MQGVREVRAVRVREAGGESFVEVMIGVSRLEGLERSHETMDLVEQAVIDGVGRAQVTVHVEPTASRERPTERVAAAALRVPGVVETHNITVLEGPDGQAVTLHVRLGPRTPMAEVPPVVARLKRRLARSSASPGCTPTSSRRFPRPNRRGKSARTSRCLRPGPRRCAR